MITWRLRSNVWMSGRSTHAMVAGTPPRYTKLPKLFSITGIFIRDPEWRQYMPRKPKLWLLWYDFPCDTWLATPATLSGAWFAWQVLLVRALCYLERQAMRGAIKVFGRPLPLGSIPRWRDFLFR